MSDDKKPVIPDVYLYITTEPPSEPPMTYAEVRRALAMYNSDFVSAPVPMPRTSAKFRRRRRPTLH